MAAVTRPAFSGWRRAAIVVVAALFAVVGQPSVTSAQGADTEAPTLTIDAPLDGANPAGPVVDLNGTLGLGHYEVLATLFG